MKNIINSFIADAYRKNELMERYNLTKEGARRVQRALDAAAQRFTDRRQWTLVYVDNTIKAINVGTKKPGTLASSSQDSHIDLGRLFLHAVQDSEVGKTRVAVIAPSGEILSIVDESAAVATAKKIDAMAKAYVSKNKPTHADIDEDDD